MERQTAKQPLAPTLVPVVLAGVGAASAAVASLALSAPGLTELAGIAVLLLAAAIADWHPVPLEGSDTGGVSLLFVFCVAALVLFGWEAGVLVGVVPALLQARGRPPVRALYNASVLAVAGAAAGAALAPLALAGEGAGVLVAAVALAAAVHYLVNLALVSLVVAGSGEGPLRTVVRSSFTLTILPFALMGSVALILVVLWQRSPLLSAALAGPMLTIALYGRARHSIVHAMRLALTDPLTGLGNHRHFHDRLERELTAPHAHDYPLSLCLVDVDDFKLVNDRHGHPAGDAVLRQLATKLRGSGEAFRLGGDEFAILLPGHDERAAVVVAEAVLERLGARGVGPAAGAAVTVSAGIAATSDRAISRAELVHRADNALYWAKEYGKNQARAWRPGIVEIVELERLASSPNDALRFRAAAALARAVDLHACAGSHSERVADLAARLAQRLGHDREQVELTRFAAQLHDLGKLGIPEEILRKPGPLSATERRVLERHPQIAFRMLEPLGADPVRDWVLRHHERWDGGGYPEGLPAESIPVSARVIFVADAYDAMTSDRVYRSSLRREEALAEMVRCAGSQFDPAVVRALVAELAEDDFDGGLDAPRAAA